MAFALPAAHNPTPEHDSPATRVCVIGAGSSGLAVANSLKRAGVAFDCLEREDRLGGNWVYGKPASSVYRSTHLISSKKLTEYVDFPMPEEYPEYPSHELVLAYLEDYARAQGLLEHIEFNAAVRSVRREEGGWRVELESGEARRYGRLVIANGHNWDPRLPDLPGEFDGLALHSADYKTPDVLEGRRVLVVGGGNSGCDIAAEAARHARSARLSLRRGYHFLPKFFHGTPIDVCGERMLRWRLPLPLRRALASGMVFLVQGPPQWAGFPQPDHKLFQTHPIINSQVIYCVQHGDLELRPDVERLTGGGVRFVDGREEAFDVIVYATGFKISFPFIEREELNWRGERPELYLNVFHPQRDDLFVAGLIQPDGGQFGLVDHQARCIAEYLAGLDEGRPAALRFQQEKRNGTSPTRVRYVQSPRHLLEVEHFSYRRRLKKLHRRLRRR